MRLVEADGGAFLAATSRGRARVNEEGGPFLAAPPYERYVPGKAASFSTPIYNVLTLTRNNIPVEVLLIYRFNMDYGVVWRTSILRLDLQRGIAGGTVSRIVGGQLALGTGARSVFAAVFQDAEERGAPSVIEALRKAIDKGVRPTMPSATGPAEDRVIRSLMGGDALFIYEYLSEGMTARPPDRLAATAIRQAALLALGKAGVSLSAVGARAESLEVDIDAILSDLADMGM